MENRLYALLTGNQAVAEAVADRVYPANVPVGDGFPRVVYARTSSKPAETLVAASTYNVTTMRLDCQGRTFESAKLLCDAVETALHKYRSVADGIDCIRVIDTSHNTEPAVDAGNVPIFSHSIECVVSWR